MTFLSYPEQQKARILTGAVFSFLFINQFEKNILKS